MARESLLGHIASRFTQPENLATESLSYIVGCSLPARRALLSFINHNLELKIPDTVVFRTQVSGPDGSIPDVVGITPDGERAVIIEAKFWAGLTDNQPSGYLQQLPPGRPAVLLFVAPALRLTILWHELLKRCNDANVRINLPTQQPFELHFGQIAGCHVLALTSWRAILDQMRSSLNIEGDTSAISDLGQLQGLCERMDQEAFLPLHEEELTSSTATRVRQFIQLVNDLASKAVQNKLASWIPNTMISWSQETYWYPLKIHDFNCYLQVSFPLWARHRCTPIWLRIADAQGQAPPRIRDLFASLEQRNPPGVVYVDQFPHVPLPLPLGMEREEVLANLFEQVKEVARLLA